MVERKLAKDVESLHSGRLEGISLPDLIWMLRDGRKTGVLTLQRSGIEKSVYFDDGAIVFAGSTDPDDRLGELLLRQGTITLDQLDDALANLHLGKRLGTLLVEAGAMGADKLVQAVLTQVQMIVLDLFTWGQGDFRFEEGSLPTDEVITLNMKTNEILRCGIRRIRSFVRTRRSVGPPRTVYALADDWREATDGPSLSEPEQLVIAGLERGDRSIDQLCREVMLSNFEIHETLWVLKVQGVVVERIGRFAGDDDASHHGNLEAGGFVKALVGLSRERATGVLYLRRRADERSFHFREGRCDFATSSNPDHGLVAFLLMRGVISLRDRQETDKRLLSNKRVGTILRELGVIDDKDLHVMVRQQLSEIVFDTFRFEDGDLSFVPGELPSNEEITLDASAESLVLEGLRRVTSWSRIQAGCGGMETPLQLTPDYMDVLDAMGAGAAEWQVITALRSAKTARELCRETKLDDFRTCQILWALIELGAVQEAIPARTADALESAAPAADAGAVAAVPSIEIAAAETAPTADDAVEVAQSEPAPPTAIPTDPPGAPSSLQTQAISREAVTAALASAERPDPSIDATQAIPRSTVEAALTGGPHEERPGRAAPVEPAEPIELGEPIELDEPVEPLGPIEIDTAPEAPTAAPAAVEPPSAPSARPDDPSVWDLESATRTMQLPREEVDAALRPMQAERDDSPDEAPDDAAVSAPAGRDRELPGDLEAILERFNAMQRVVYRVIRAEVGAGAANFIRSCCDTTSDSVDPLKGAELKSDGSWDIEGLRRAVQENHIRDPRLVYQALIDREIELLRDHIGEARVLELERQIERVEQAAASHP